MTLFVHLMSQAMARHPGWIEQIGNKLDGIPSEKKLEFMEVAARSTAESQRRIALANGIQNFSPDEVLVPFRQWNADGTGIGSSKITNNSKNGRPIQTANQPTTNTLQK